MIKLKKEQTCLIELLKASLFNLSPVIPDDVKWEKVIKLAKSHVIVPLIASGVPENLKNELLEITCLSKAHFMKMMHEQGALVNLFEKKGISYFIFKGTAAAIYYPNPSLRTYGDIDFYVFDNDMNLAKELLRKNGYINTGYNKRHYEYVKNGIEFELHNRISMQDKYDIDHLVVNNLKSTVISRINNCSFVCLPPCENGLVLLWHIMHHLTSYGLGLRQIIDWMMFVHNELDDVTWEAEFKPLAIKAGCEKLAVTVTYMCKKWLGLSDKITWCDSANEEFADQLFIRVLDDGNFGRDRAPVESLKVLINKEGFFQALHHTGMINWPLAQKYAIIRPFAWLYQFCRYVCKGFVGLFKGKKVYLKNNHNINLEDLWESF